ncbi:MAG: DUF721 domain-containing protein [Actinomycetaceae bacterium]
MSTPGDPGRGEDRTEAEDVDEMPPVSPDALAHAVLARARAAAWDKGLRTTPAPRRSGGWDRSGDLADFAADASGETQDVDGDRPSGRRRPWRPGPGLGWAGSGSSPSRRDPQPIGRIGKQLVRRRGWGREISIATEVVRWREIVGDQVADHCEVETFSDGELVLRASSTAWATQVRLLLPQLERRFEEVAGEGTVATITVL